MKEKKFIAMSQPTFLPWSGYFDLIDSVKNFVFLNDAQFSKLSWHSRNKIIINNKTSWISLPVFHKSNDQLINDTLIISNKKNLNKILKTIKQNYSKTKFYNIYSDEFENKLLKCFSFKFLDEFNIEIIKWIIDKIGIKTKVFKSSDLKINEARSNRIIKICEKFKTKN